MPLPVNGGGVAARAEQFGQREFVGTDPGLRFGTERAEDPDPVGITPGQQCRAGSRAYRLPHVKTGKAHPFRSHAVEVRRFDIGRTEAAEILVTLIVSEDDDDIRQLWSAALAGSLARMAPTGQSRKHQHQTYLPR